MTLLILPGPLHLHLPLRCVVGFLMVSMMLTFMHGFGQSMVMSGHTEVHPRQSIPTKASYVYNIAKLIDWPAKYKRGAFIIGYIGDPVEYESFAQYINRKTIGNQRVYTTYIERFNDLPSCHILFVDRESQDTVESIVSGVPNNNTLVISRCRGGLDKGATINLVQHNGNLRFELSEETAKNHRLFIGSSLRGLAFNENE